MNNSTNPNNSNNIKHIGVNFSQSEITALLSGRKRTHRFPLKNTRGNLISLDGLQHQISIGDYSPFNLKPNDLIWAKETYHYNEKSNTLHYREEDDLIIDAWTPSARMPKKHSRIMLHVKRLVVSRLHDITDDGAVLEGFPSNDEARNMAIEAGMSWFQKSRVWFKTEWELKYRDWHDNPLVYMVEFELIKKTY